MPEGNAVLAKLTASLLIFLLLGGCVAATSSVSIPATATTGGPEQIPATVYRPEGSGPFPAVVMMHDCSGLGPRSSGAPARWARELVAHGYVVILPDSFTTRGHAGGVCTDASPGRAEVRPSRRARDAYAALAYARRLPYVDGSRVGLMGGSHGGSTTLTAMVAPASERDPLAREKQSGFAAAVALYPGCAARLGDWRVTRASGTSGPITEYVGTYKPIAPLLILVGEADDWTPAEPCRRLTEAAQRAGQPVRIKIYPGAHHSFDSDRPVRYRGERVNSNSPTGRGATTGSNPQAWEDAIREVLSFFGQNLREKKK
jgi:dienelactone hydrolase